MSAATDTRLSALDGVLDQARSQVRMDPGLLGRVLNAVQGGPSADDVQRLGPDLFAVVDLLDSSAALRRALTDPGATPDRRRALVHSLLDGKMSGPAVNVVAAAVGQRWSSGRTFAAALERQGVRATLMGADDDGTLEDTEDELFRFARLVEANPDLRNTLADRGVGLTARQGLVAELLAGRATDTTVALARRAVAARERTFGNTIEGFVTLAAAQKNRVVATVRVAQPLSGEQRERLRASLTQQVGREVAIQELIDPAVLGGVRVELGSEVFEGTVAARLEAARRLFGDQH
jgi:F-type H+-transporting ATPase subunit delta